ncbi:glycosyltransferase family 4 protein [haloarchaeon 3A1-DGR]|nr:glycosyltransferase family 4 protein [haloarchaeon 3A1-DGR]
MNLSNRNQNQEIIFIFPGNLNTVRGGTEPYYVYEYLSDNFSTTLVQTTDKPDQTVDTNGDNTTISIPRPTSGLYSLLPFFLYFDIAALLTLWRKDFDKDCALWTYRGLVLTPLLLKFRLDCRWIIDIRAPPVKQDVEFQQLRGNLNVVRRAYYYMMYIIYRQILDIPDKKIAVSPALKEFLVERYNLEPEEVYVQTLGVNMERFRPHKVDVFDKNNVSIVLLSSISIYRGVDTLIEMLSLLNQEEVRAELHILGSGRDKAIQEFKDMAMELGVDEQIIWHGDVDHEKIPQMLERFDIAVAPYPDTVSYNLCSPAKTFEYLAMNLIVLGSDLKCHQEIIDHKRNGLLVAPEDPAEWADAVQCVCSDKTLQRTIQSYARESVRPYDWNTMIPELVKSVLVN